MASLQSWRYCSLVKTLPLLPSKDQSDQSWCATRLAVTAPHGLRSSCFGSAVQPASATKTPSGSNALWMAGVEGSGIVSEQSPRTSDRFGGRAIPISWRFPARFRGVDQSHAPSKRGSESREMVKEDSPKDFYVLLLSCY